VIDVDLDALDRQARRVELLGEDLRACAARWHTALADPCAPSVAAVRDAYLKEFSVYAEALDSWAGAVHTAVATYDAVDQP
jgi:hypothetical protein